MAGVPGATQGLLGVASLALLLCRCFSCQSDSADCCSWQPPGFSQGIARRVLQHCQGVACRSVSLGVICITGAGCAVWCLLHSGLSSVPGICLASLLRLFIVLVFPCAPAHVNVCMTCCCLVLAHGEPQPLSCCGGHPPLAKVGAASNFPLRACRVTMQSLSTCLRHTSASGSLPSCQCAGPFFPSMQVHELTPCLHVYKSPPLAVACLCGRHICRCLCLHLFSLSSFLYPLTARMWQGSACYSRCNAVLSCCLTPFDG